MDSVIMIRKKHREMAKMRYELVIFDLDGTLLNTLGDLADATNAALREAGFPPRSEEEVRTFIGGGVARMIRRAVPAGTDEDTVETVLKGFKKYYLENVNVRTQPYPGIPALLDAMGAAGIRAAVNSNKVDAASQLLCRAHFGDRLSMVLGEREGIPKKPAPDGAKYIMQTLGARPERTLYVGDGDADLLTAQNAGIDCAWVNWGYRRREELTGLDIPLAFDSVEALRNFILQ